MREPRCGSIMLSGSIIANSNGTFTPAVIENGPGVSSLVAITLIRDMLENGVTGSVVTLLCNSGERYRSPLYDNSWLSAHGFDIAPAMARLDAVFGSAH